MIKLQEKERCTSCMACYNACPNGAIEIITGQDGFYYPKINSEKCSNCKSCLKVCPSLNENKNLFNFDIKEIYAATNRDFVTRQNSSSGGLFRVFADYIISKGGYVAGVVLDDDLIARHIVSNNPDDVKRMQGSKYIQSQIGDCFKIIKKHLDDDNYVLFTGTPCQAAGLKSYLNKDYKKLLIIDLICSCVNPPYILKEVVKTMIEDKDEYNVTKVNFRDKITGWGGNPAGWFSMCTEWKDKNNNSHRHYENCFENLFFNGFLNHIWMKDSCHHCVYSSCDRVSDITLGDFWCIDFYDKTLNDNNGLSFVKLNTQKGKEYFEDAKDRLDICKKIDDYSWAINTQSTINGIGYEKHNRRDLFFEYAKKTDSVLNLTKDMLGINKVGILTYDFSENFGAVLQAYALSEKIKRLGFDPKIISWRWEFWDCVSNFERFRDNYLNRSYKCISEQELKAQIADCSKIIVGGDQVFRVWNTDKTLPFLRYFGDFVEGNITLASYAASFGVDFFNSAQNIKNKVKTLLKRFDKIAVREKSGVDMLKTTFDVDGVEVIDPVFLLSRQDYENLAYKAQGNCPSNYIAYMCLQDLFATSAIEKIFKEKFPKSSVINININNQGEFNEVEQWLRYIKNSEFVMTDSFHCVCFSIIFHKPFVVISRDFGGNSRVENILSKLNLKDRMKSSVQDVNDSDISYHFDWDAIENILDKEREFAQNYLLDVLLMKPKNKEKYFDSELELIRMRHETDYRINQYNTLKNEFNNKINLALNKDRYIFKYRLYRLLLNLPFVNKKSIKIKKEKYKQKVQQIKACLPPPLIKEKDSFSCLF